MQPNDFFETMLSRAWQQINHRVFGGALLVPPTFRITSMHHHAADWSVEQREIRFSRSFIENRSWLTVIEVLKHEMAHQYVSDVLGVEDETSHGPAFQMVCQRYGIDGRASATQRSEREKHAIEKIKKLLALSASPNENEARAALRKAQELLLGNGLTEADLQSEPDDYGVAHVGGVVLRKTPESYRSVVSHILSKHFRVRVIWCHTFDRAGHPGLQLEICGRRSDVAIAEHVHDFLHAEAERLWDRTTATGQRNRHDFLEGVMRGFLQTLDAEQRARPSSGGLSPGLVLAGMKVGLDDYYERRHPVRSNMRGSRRQRGEMYGDGISAGRSITLRKPVAGGEPKLLGQGGPDARRL